MDLISYSNPDYSWQQESFKQNKSKEIKYLPVEIQDRLIDKVEFTFIERLDMAWFLVKKMPRVISAIYIIYKSIKGNKMPDGTNKKTDLKTTILGIIQGCLVFLGVIGINVSPDDTTTILTFIGSAIGVVSIIKSWFTKDKPKEPTE